MKKYGVCALSGHEGNFVKAHIIPQSVTRLEARGIKALQLGIGFKPGWRPTSWYDDELVTQNGEDILKKLDDSGVIELKRHKLIWSGWDASWDELPQKYLSLDREAPVNIRCIRKVNSKSIRLFYLSMVWRVAVSTRWEMQEVSLAKEQINFLSNIIKGEVEDEYYYFPITFDQIITKGPLHNRTPFIEEDTIDIDNGEKITRRFVRFYFNGLVANVYLFTDKLYAKAFSKMAIGSDDDLVLICRRFEGSRELADIKKMGKY